MLQETIINEYMYILQRLTRGYKEDLSLITNQILFLENRDKLTDPDYYEGKLFRRNIAMQQ